MPEEYGDRERYPLVYIPDERCFGIVVSYGAFVSRVRYFTDGTEYEVDMENTEFIERKDVNFGYVTE
jgi:hypothetical protein